MTTSKIPPLSSRQKYESTHAMLTRQIELVQRVSYLSFDRIQELVYMALADGKCSMEDHEEFKTVRRDILSTLSLIVMLHKTGVVSNRIIQAKLNRFVTDCNIYQRVMREELTP